jgi:hypothetical protein
MCLLLKVQMVSSTVQIVISWVRFPEFNNLSVWQLELGLYIPAVNQNSGFLIPRRSVKRMALSSDNTGNQQQLQQQQTTILQLTYRYRYDNNIYRYVPVVALRMIHPERERLPVRYIYI